MNPTIGSAIVSPIEKRRNPTQPTAKESMHFGNAQQWEGIRFMLKDMHTGHAETAFVKTGFPIINTD